MSPPTAALLFVPLAAFTYGWAALVWTAVTVVALGLALCWARRVLSKSHGDHQLFVLVMWSTPAVFELVGAGQDTALALLIVMLSLRRRLAFAAGTRRRGRAAAETGRHRRLTGFRRWAEGRPPNAWEDVAHGMGSP
ncbi:glycosyltransferase family 87 protein [Friedmanniella luteola]|uniref:glycosyltransferase family 87 protein n=1 Tax=Friedmanniella luteola TaxID=546871 RepID=UPI003CCA504A